MRLALLGLLVVVNEGEAMPERTFFRVGAGAAMVGAVLGFIFNLLHPRSSGAPDDLEAELQLVADSGIWLFDHFMIEWSIAIGFVGLVAIARSLTDGTEMSWGRLALASAIAGVAATFVTVGVDGMAMKQTATEWTQASGADEATALATANAVWQVALALFTVTIGTLFGLTPVFFGLATLMSDAYPRWLGYVALGAGLLGLLTASIQFLAGASALTANVMFPVSSLLFTVWLFFAGLHLWRRTPGGAPVTEARRAVAA